MNTNNTLLTLSTIALVFTGTVDAANSELLYSSPVAVSQLKDGGITHFATENSTNCNPGDPRPDCRPNDDCVCMAA